MKLDLKSRILLILVCAQVIITIDTTFMNVSISQLIVDLNTTVTGIQGAITMYALVMAALMIAGAKVGDIIGRKKAFIAGLLIYGVGTITTSLAVNLTMFITGWSLLEGMGAALMLPAMMSLIADNFPAGPARAKAYAAFASAAGIAAAVGPIVGGLFTTYLSWRLAFACELLVVAFILVQRNIIHEQKITSVKPKFDWLGFGLSSTGLVVMVQGIILASSYGMISTRKDFVLMNKTLLSAGDVSPTVILVIAGLLILGIFGLLESWKLRNKKHTLLDVNLLKIRAVNAGSLVVLMQALVLTGVIFSLSLYVQMQLNYNAIDSGMTLMPLSLGVLIFAGVAGKILAKKYSPKSLMFIGFSMIVIGTFAMGIIAKNAKSGMDFAVGLSFIGAGIGFIVSQNQNLIISSVKPRYTNETSGIINTANNIGSSLGTSIAGAVILSIFILTASSNLNNSSAFNAQQKQRIDKTITDSAQIISNQELVSKTENIPTAQQQALLEVNDVARKKSLSAVYYFIGTAGLFGLALTTRLPKTKPLAA